MLITCLIYILAKSLRWHNTNTWAQQPNDQFINNGHFLYESTAATGFGAFIHKFFNSLPRLSSANFKKKHNI